MIENSDNYIVTLIKKALSNKERLFSTLNSIDGYIYFNEKTLSLFNENDIDDVLYEGFVTIINFEITVSSDHTINLNNDMKFSSKEQIIAALKKLIQTSYTLFLSVQNKVILKYNDIRFLSLKFIFSSLQHIDLYKAANINNAQFISFYKKSDGLNVEIEEKIVESLFNLDSQNKVLSTIEIQQKLFLLLKKTQNQNLINLIRQKQFIYLFLNIYSEYRIFDRNKNKINVYPFWLEIL